MMSLNHFILLDICVKIWHKKEMWLNSWVSYGQIHVFLWGHSDLWQPSATFSCMLPRDNSSSSSRESAADGLLGLGDWGSVAADPHSRSAGIETEGVRGCSCDGEVLWVSRPTRSIRISDVFVRPVPVRWRKAHAVRKQRSVHFQTGNAVCVHPPVRHRLHGQFAQRNSQQTNTKCTSLPAYL